MTLAIVPTQKRLQTPGKKNHYTVFKQKRLDHRKHEGKAFHFLETVSPEAKIIGLSKAIQGTLSSPRNSKEVA
jgi:hypothetical protein